MGKETFNRKKKNAGIGLVCHGRNPIVRRSSAKEIPIQFALYSSPSTNRTENFIKALQKAGIEAEEISPQLMRSVSDTTTPQGILIVVKAQPLPIQPDPSLVLILDGIHDPGNLGTIFRTAAAAAVDLILLAPGCAIHTRQKWFAPEWELI